METLNITPEQYLDLHKRGTNYARVLGVSGDNIDEVLSRSFVRLCTCLDEHPPENQPLIADNFWRKAVYQSVVDDYRQRQRMTVEWTDPLPDSTGDLYETEDFAHKLLAETFEFLTEDDIIVILALVDCDLNMKAAADYLGEQRTNMYHVVKRIRDKVRVHFPDLVHFHTKNGTPQPYIWKIGDWSRTLMAVEVVDYEEWSPAFYDKSEQYRVTGHKFADRNTAQLGLQPGSTPTFRTIMSRRWSTQEPLWSEI